MAANSLARQGPATAEILIFSILFIINNLDNFSISSSNLLFITFSPLVSNNIGGNFLFIKIFSNVSALHSIPLELVPITIRSASFKLFSYKFLDFINLVLSDN